LTKPEANNSTIAGDLKPPASNTFLTGQARIIIISLFATLACVGIIKAATTIGTNISTGGTITGSGANTLYGATSIGGALTATSTLSVTGLTTLGNASTTVLSVSGNSYLATTTVTGYLTATSDVEFTDTTTVRNQAGSNLVTDGGFADDTPNCEQWNPSGSSWDCATGAAVKTAGNTQTISQSITITVGKKYMLRVHTVVTASSATISIGGVDVFTSVDATKSRNKIFTALSTAALTVTPDAAAFAGTIDNFVLYEVTDTGLYVGDTTNDIFPTVTGGQGTTRGVVDIGADDYPALGMETIFHGTPGNISSGIHNYVELNGSGWSPGGGAGANAAYGFYTWIEDLIQSKPDSLGEIYGGRVNVAERGGGNLAEMTGLLVDVEFYGEDPNIGAQTGTITAANGLKVTLDTSADDTQNTYTITTYKGLNIDYNVNGTASKIQGTNAYGIFIDSMPAYGGTGWTTQTGINIQPQDTGTYNTGILFTGTGQGSDITYGSKSSGLNVSWGRENTASKQGFYMDTRDYNATEKIRNANPTCTWDFNVYLNDDAAGKTCTEGVSGTADCITLPTAKTFGTATITTEDGNFARILITAAGVPTILQQDAAVFEVHAAIGDCLDNTICLSDSGTEVTVLNNIAGADTFYLFNMFYDCDD
jgi:hypothetical protein